VYKLPHFARFRLALAASKTEINNLLGFYPIWRAGFVAQGQTVDNARLVIITV